jgi:hypothetical protein
MIDKKRDQFGYRFGQLRTPLSGYRAHSEGYGLDNGCFSDGLNNSWFRMVDEARKDNCMFVAVPDVVGSARRTLELYEYFRLKLNGVKRALVIQDGIENHNIPWGDISAVFIGGTDQFKYSQAAINVAKAAKIMGKHVHVGRVNTMDRYDQWRTLGDTLDGTGLSKYDHMIATLLQYIRNDSQIKLDY